MAEKIVKDSQGLAKDLVNDCISRQAAIDSMTNTLWHYPNECYRNLNEYEFAKGLAELGLKSVPPAQPESADCIYCHEDSDGYVKPIEKNCHAFIRFGMNGWEISLSAKGWNGSAKIRYCPMCGRDLYVK